MPTDRLDIVRPDDWHLHLRDGEAMASVGGHTARRFGRAIVMPNLKPPVSTVAQALAYRERILAAVPAGLEFEPLMTLYLTRQTTPEEIAAAKGSGRVVAVKFYPQGATTNSAAGVADLSTVYPVLEAMEKADLPLLVHGEVTDPAVDVFDREKTFIDRHMVPLRARFPNLRVVFEHITTANAVQFVQAQDRHVAATITVHHLLLNRNALFDGGVRPHHFCAPVLKREQHRQALLGAATGGDPRFFLGTDSAPHPREAKLADCGCAGIFTAHAAIELYAEAFEEAGKLENLEGFASFHGPDFYRLPRNTGRLVLERRRWTVPETVPLGGSVCVPMRAGGSIAWSIAEATTA